ncbi:MAG TPA: TerC family protein [Chitinophagales bacterium]|nr:TerC family protein [Chitinophagales bacterium]HMX60130.1 TerC family protein [Chitinophagales bacterium]HMY22802.1 TerC family protein [Chitinophagales bacterium]HMZ34274.1 TerC family protein [Chitinophagales bacterium]HNA38056.1 TerC family protein [Chitinophagales bacterium]
MEVSIWYWIGFNLFVCIMLALDLGVFHKKSHAVKIKEALAWSAVWVCFAMLFNIGVYYSFGKEKAIEFFTGYVIEKALSVDNIFVFVMVFSYFNIPKKYQHKILFWGIIGALILRAIFIFAGVALISKFHWIIYVFGAFLVITGIKMMVQDEKPLEPDKNPLVRLFKKFMPVTNTLHGAKFFVSIDAVKHATPLFIVLLLIEFTDLIFATDSIPAILAITNDTFIVYTSNVFAILGLRSLYFALDGITAYFRFLKYGLSLILVFVGTKMCIADFYKIEIVHSLAIILVIITISILASLLIKSKEINE